MEYNKSPQGLKFNENWRINSRKDSPEHSYKNVLGFSIELIGMHHSTQDLVKHGSDLISTYIYFYSYIFKSFFFFNYFILFFF